MSHPPLHVRVDAQVGQTWVGVYLVPVMVPFHVVPTSIPDVVHPFLNTLSVQIEHQQENDADQGQHQSKENIRGLQDTLHVG